MIEQAPIQQRNLGDTKSVATKKTCPVAERALKIALKFIEC